MLKIHTKSPILHRNLQQIKPINPVKSSNPHEKRQTQKFKINTATSEQIKNPPIKPHQAVDPAIRNPHEQIRPPITTAAIDQSIKPLQPTPTTNSSNDPAPPTTR